MAGAAALNYLGTAAMELGIIITDNEREKIKFDLAEGYIDILISRLDSDGKAPLWLNYKSAWDLHTDKLGDHGLPPHTWTLDPVFKALPEASRETYWKSAVGSAGELSGELGLAIVTNRMMSISSAIAPPDISSQSKAWLDRVDSISGITTVLDSIAKQTGDAIQEALTPEDGALPPLGIKIEIIHDPQPQQNIEDEGAARADVQQGFVTREPTHQVSFSDGSLDKPDFFSVQVAAAASGSVRIGNNQLDANVKPEQHLSQFYPTDNPGAGPDFSLKKAAMLNGLSASTTHNVYIDPLLLDLTGTGVQMKPISDGVLFDIDNSGTLKRSGWAGAGTGMLVMAGADGLVSNISQIFSEFYGGQPGTAGQAGERPFKDAFAALASVDGNADALITAADPLWAQLRVWVDAAAGGSVQEGELKTLDELNITQLSVAAEPVQGDVRQGNTVVARGGFVMGGETREALAVNFLADPVSNVLTVEGSGTRLVSTTADTTVTAYASQSPTGVTLDAGQLAVGNLYGGVGDDTLIAAPTGSWLVGGGGANSYVGGAGDDVFVISASDDPSAIKGNGGRDMVLVVGDEGVALNLAKAGVTMAQGGRGSDYLFSGGINGVFLKGGTGDATLVGGAGNDVLVGGSGRNTLVGGIGKALIYAGRNGDRIMTAKGDSIVYAGGGDDYILGREGDDVIVLGHGNATIDGGGGTNLVSLHGSHGEYLIEPTATGFRITDQVAGRNGVATLSNIQNVNFADISAVTLNSPNAMPVNDTFAVDREGVALDRQRAQSFSPAQLLGNDQLMASQGPLKIAAVSDAMGGSVSLTETGDVLFTPDPSSHGAMGFKYGVVDQAGNPAASVVALGTGELAPMRAAVSLRSAEMPSDPMAAKQWYIGDIGVLPVWQDYSGKGVRIGQFEPAGEFSVGPEIFDIEHPDLSANVDPVWLQTQKTNGTLPELKSNHATMVAGVMVAARNDVGGVGIAPGATLGGHHLANSGADLTGLANMLNYDVANHSWGFSKPFALSNLNDGQINTAAALVTNAQYASGSGRGGLGAVIVTSGGNDRAAGGSAQGSMLNSNRFSIQVGAINAQADLSTLQVGSAPFSNPGTSLLISAPGSNVLSTSHALETERGALFGNPYSAMQGTSFAAPIVSGVVALMLEANPGLGYRDVQQILAVSARSVSYSTTQWSDNAGTRWNGGGLHKSDDYGFGQVDARAAVRLAESWTLKSTAANLSSVAKSSEQPAQGLAAGETISQTLTLPDGVNIEHLEVDFTADTGRLGDLTLKLISPKGTQSLLLDRVGRAPGGPDDGSNAGNPLSGEFKYRFMSTQAWGEHSAGDWTLQLSNASTGLPATLHNWTLRAHGAASSPDDQYLYTNEFGRLVAANPARGVLDDAVQGNPGGRNTLNAAALSADSVIDLATGTVNLGGTPLTISNPASITQLLGGDGNDRLLASATGSLLHGGRGHNELTGGAGKDLFVVQKRKGGSDTLHRFEAKGGEKVHMVGFDPTTLAAVVPVQEGPNVVIALEDGQRVVFADQALAQVEAGHLVAQRAFEYSADYFAVDVPAPEAAPVPGLIMLTGGGGRVGMTSGKDGQWVGSLGGVVYERAGLGSNTFRVALQASADSYGNAVRGFRHGIDKVDVSLLGISAIAELEINKSSRLNMNGIALINGVTVDRPSPGAKSTQLLYLDAIEVAQLTADDFIFAPPAVAQPPVALMALTQLDPVPTLAAPLAEQPAPSASPLIQAMAAFAPSESASFLASTDLAHQQPLLAANAA